MLAPASLRDRLDIHKCTRMALLHDVAEAVVGDITPRDGVGKAEKGRREGASMDWIMGRLLGGQGQRVVGEELRALWQEYEDDVTAEARFVHDVDKFELMCQMVEYERLQEGRRADLGEFCGVLKAVTTREVMEWCLEVLRERREFWGERYDGLKGVGAEVELVEKIKLLK